MLNEKYQILDTFWKGNMFFCKIGKSKSIFKTRLKLKLKLVTNK